MDLGKEMSAHSIGIPARSSTATERQIVRKHTYVKYVKYSLHTTEEKQYHYPK